MVFGHVIQQIRCSSVETSAERYIFQPDKQPTTGSELNAHPSPPGPMVTSMDVWDAREGSERKWLVSARDEVITVYFWLLRDPWYTCNQIQTSNVLS